MGRSLLQSTSFKNNTTLISVKYKINYINIQIKNASNRMISFDTPYFKSEKILPRLKIP